MAAVLYDIRHGVRLLVRSPGFTLVVLVTLALGIGANTAVFSMVNAALLRPLPYPEADRIVMVSETLPIMRGRETPPIMTNVTLEAWRDSPHTIDHIAGYSNRGFTLRTAGEPIPLRGAAVTPALFPLLSATPLLGRVLESADEVLGNHQVAVLSYSAWQTHHGGDPSILGRLITLDDQAYTVVGIMPTAFAFPDAETQLWVPLTLTNPDLRPGQRMVMAFSGLARLREEVTIEQAQAEGQSMVAASAPARGAEGRTLGLVGLHEGTASHARPALLTLMATVGVVLLIAAANIANLLLARGARRQRELAIRSAVGAGRGRLVRQLLTESLVLAGVGGIVGVGVAYWTLGTVPTFAPPNVPGLDGAGIDRTVLSFAMLTSLSVGLVCGMAPAIQASRFNLVGALSGGSTPMGGGFRFRPGNRTRSVLVIIEVALALVLLIGAGLLVRSFLTLTSVDPGFDPAGVLTAQLTLAPSKYGDPSATVPLFDQLLERATARSTVESAGLVSALPLTAGESIVAFWEYGQPVPSGPEEMFTARPQMVSPSYLEAMGLTLVDGRFLDARDTANSPPVFVANQAFARAYFSLDDVVGRRVDFGQGPREVVGVVADVQHRGLDAAAQPELYYTYRQPVTSRGSRRVSLVVRTSGEPSMLLPFLRDDVHAVDPTLPIDSVTAMSDRLASSVAEPRFYAMVLGVFAAGALVLAGVGIYGVLAYTVANRRSEIGLRMALGADGTQVRTLVMKQGLWLVGVGLGLGLAGAILSMRIVESLLFGITTSDPTTYVAVPLLVVGVALAACYLPAVRATRVDPIRALRAD